MNEPKINPRIKIPIQSIGLNNNKVRSKDAIPSVVDKPNSLPERVEAYRAITPKKPRRTPVLIGFQFFKR